MPNEPQTKPELLDEAAIAEIEARANAATKGPWAAKCRNWPIGDTGDYEPCADVYAVYGDVDKPRAIGLFHELTLDDDAQKANCEFTAHARIDIPALIQTVRAAWAERDKWQQANAEAAREINCAGPVAYRIRILKQEHEQEVTALREQLAEAATKIEWQASTIEQLTTGVTGCAERLAQVEKERERIRAQFYKDDDAEWWRQFDK